MSVLQLVECPRDAMQGIGPFIPTETKIAYLNALLRVGFHTLDFGSFVSPKAVPQLADTAQVLAGLDLSGTDTRLLAIVANRRGAETACGYPEIHYLGYPFSISETFQQRNTRRSIVESLELVEQMQGLCAEYEKELVVYLSMAFGNPYGDPWSPAVAEYWVAELAGRGVKTLALADTIGVAEGQTIGGLFKALLTGFPAVTFGAHFHAHPAQRREKIAAAWEAGCRRFDVALQGFGGCPFAEDELVGNIATESLLSFCQEIGQDPGLDKVALAEASQWVPRVFAV